MLEHLLYLHGVLRGAIFLKQVHLHERDSAGLLQQRTRLAHVDIDAHLIYISHARFVNGAYAVAQALTLRFENEGTARRKL